MIVGKDGFFKVGDIALGKPALTEAQVGEVYGSIPPAKTPHPRGTVVSPVVYGLQAPVAQPDPLPQDDLGSRPHCPKPTHWNRFMERCASQSDFANYCEDKYPGSVPAANKPQGCACPKGTVWNKKHHRCAMKKKKKRSNASRNYKNLCAMGKGKAILVWDANGNRYGCQDKKYGSKNFAARETPIIVAVPEQIEGRHVDCPVSSWPPKTNRVDCVPQNARSPKPGRCVTYHLTQISKNRYQKYCYYFQ